MYAKRLEDVPLLDAALRRQGLDIISRAGDVAGLLALDANLGLLLWLVAGLGGAGYLLSLGAGLWAGVERRRGSFAILRLLGFSGRTLALLPIMQSLALGIGGVGLASVMAFVAAGILNHTFRGTLGLDQPLCRLSWAIIGAATMLTTGGAGLAALAAGARVGRVEPWEGLR
jgi:putative ABC transport system permease protein